MCSRAWSVRRSLWLVALAVTGCGSKGIDGNPFQHTDSGIPDIQGSDVPRADTHNDTSTGIDTGPSPDLGDAAPTDTAIPGVVVVVAPNQPAQDAIVPTAQRFVPQVTVIVTMPSGSVSDNLDTLIGELWSTDANPKKLSTTTLTLTSRLGTIG